MSRNLFYILACVAICGSVFAEGFSGGSGILNDPYLIATPEDMVAISADPFNTNKYFKLTADIDMTGYSDSYVPIGEPTNPFGGHFNGDYYTISNLSFNTIGFSYIGIFGYVDRQGQVWNLTVENINIVAEQSVYVAGIVGYNTGLVSKCDVVDSNISGGSGVGGITGFNSGEIKYCNVSNTTITGESGVGGISGYSQVGYIFYCTASVVLNGGDFVGGIVGAQDQVSVIDYCGSSVSATGGEYVGGIAGFNSFSTITNSDSTGTVNGTLYTGGLVGYNLGDIRDSTTNTNVNGGNYVGGIAGYNKFGTIIRTTSYGIVTGVENVDDFIGENVGGIFIPDQDQFEIADLNRDGVVNDADFDIFTSEWLSEGPNLISDLNRDGIVDYEDFAILTENWPEDAFPNRADLNEDGIVDEDDLILMMEQWLATGSDIDADFNDDNEVNLLDFVFMAENWLASDA